MPLPTTPALTEVFLMPMSADEILNREFLEIRAKILEIGASLDRIDRANGSIAKDDRHRLICDGIKLLLDDDVNRAEQIQMLFSRIYESDWRETMQVPSTD